MSKVFHGVRYGIPASQMFLGARFSYTYDHLFINAKTFVQFGNSVAVLLAEKQNNIGYVLDPQTYSFQGDIELLEGENGIKKGFGKLIAVNAGPKV